MTERVAAEVEAVEAASGRTAAERFLRSARLCRIRDLEQLAIVSELVKDIGELIHALQKERGASSVFLGSNGTRFADRRALRVAESRALERAVRERLEHVDERLDRMSSGARFYARVALALHALDTVEETRSQTAALALAPQDAVQAFTDIVRHLLAVVFEAADIAADPALSRALVAVVNFVQGKEFAGQERATAGAAFSRGRFEASDLRRLRDLAAAQERAFGLFAEFAAPAHVERCRAALTGAERAEFERMRRLALAGGRDLGTAGVSGEAWYEQATRRIDALKTVEEQLALDLTRRCAEALAAARAELERADAGAAEPFDGEADSAAPAAMLLLAGDPAGPEPPAALAGSEPAGLTTLDAVRPKLMRSVLDLVQEQSRRLQDMSSQLETARAALTERKLIDRAKGILMTTRGPSEEASYALLRKTAMNQNKRIVEVAETVLAMADILKTTADGVG